MVAADGGVALTGTNVLLIGGCGKIAQDFIFIG